MALFNNSWVNEPQHIPLFCLHNCCHQRCTFIYLYIMSATKFNSEHTEETL